jgi:uncharacterized membrane protein
VLLIRWAVLSRRYDEMEERIEMVVRGRIEPGEFTSLIKRVSQLERLSAWAPPEVPPVAPQPKPDPEPEPELQPEPLPVLAAIVAPPPLAPPPPAQPVPFIPPPEPPRPSRTSAEWEALVGGNWLNKLGILVLVIALALFLGYEYPRLGPAGVSAIALALSLTMLVSGVVTEKRAHYMIFARGLIAGGWAGLYFTTYAMQALDAAKVIHNPVLGALLLLVVATGMVLHSLRYREQTLTGLAYFMAFVTLAITQVTALSVIALVPLAGSLLFIAYRFEWPGMALFALAATYATCASRGDNGAPLWQGQTVFAVYWLLFEAYDLVRARRHSNHPAESVMLPLNALGFLLLSYAKWSATAPDDLYWLAIGGAVIYLASTILRAGLRPPASFAPGTSTVERIFAGGFEGPVTLAAASSAVAAILKLQGQTVTNVLLAEGELLFLAGLFFRQHYPRRLAAVLFGALGIKLLSNDLPNSLHWTPSALTAAFVFYVNRALRKVDVSYGYAASALVALTVWQEAPRAYLGMEWLGVAAVLFLVGWSLRQVDFRLQSYLACALSVGGIAYALPTPHLWISLALTAAIAYSAALCALRSAPDRFTEYERERLQFVASLVATAASGALLWKVVPSVYLGPAWIALSLVLLELGLRRFTWELRWHSYLVGSLGAARVLAFIVLPFDPISGTPERFAIGAAALLCYVFATRVFRDSRAALNIASACGTFFVMVELWAMLDPVLVAPAWALYALLPIEIGVRLDLPGIRTQGHAASMAAFGRLFTANFDAAYRLPTVAVVAASHYYQSWRQSRVRAQLTEWEAMFDRPYLYTAAALIAYLLERELQAPFVEVGWALLALTLLAGGRVLNRPDLRYQSYALAAMAFGRTAAMEFSAPHLFAGSVVIACLFASQFMLARERFDRLYLSLLATGLVTLLLFQEVSGSMLTVAWGIEGALLLGAGFPLRDRTLRLSGLVLFLVCVGKLFLYDLRELETLYRIFSFFALGVILVAVSWLYTRFRGQIQRYL